MSNRRQELYDRIRESSKDELILSEMIRLGFWKTGEGQPAMSEDWIKRKGELTRELNQLTAKQRRYENREVLLKEIRAKRMKEARARREETKQRREEERQQRAKLWSQAKEHDIVYIGEGVSGGLGKKQSDVARLEKFQLPKINTAAELAQAMEMPIGKLRFLAYNREVSRVSHYRRFFMPKKSGGQRLISAPMPQLKAAQYWVLERILLGIPVHDAAHGFVSGRSILTNAQSHANRDIVINLDLRDFFPTVSYKRVKGLFSKLGYSEQVATLLASICTEPEADEVELDGQTYYVATSGRHLPQGAPTSPAITNLLCFRLDKRLTGVAKSLGFRYTRYADDITFSSRTAEASANVKKLMWRVHSVVRDEGFVVHPDKTRIMRRGSRQEVTGLTVNDRPAIPRDDLRRFRALLYQVEKDGHGGKHWRGGKAHLLSAIRGYANFIKHVDPNRGAKYVEQAQQLLKKHGWSHEVVNKPKPESAPEAAESEEKKGGWWRLKFWGK